MNWRTANRNKRRALRRKTVQIEPRYFMRNPDIAWDSWKEWLDLLMPTMLNENSLVAQLWNRRKPSPLTTRTPIQIPRLPRFNSPDRAMNVWRQIWLAQDRKCAECKTEIALEDSTKRGFSFEIICKACFQKRPPVFIIVDDIDYPDPPPAPDKVYYDDLSVPPPPPMITKHFIYGDNWCAYKRLFTDIGCVHGITGRPCLTCGNSVTVVDWSEWQAAEARKDMK